MPRLSIPAALLGILAFFLPWLEVSCGPVKLRFSGYEFATGRWEEKIRPSAFDSFWRERTKELKGKLRTERAPESAERQKPTPKDFPLLWIVPVAYLVLISLALLGLPRIPTFFASVAAGAYLAYFGVTFEQQASDPRNTGGILDHSWVFGFWAAWIGLVVPMIMALIRPRRS